MGWIFLLAAFVLVDLLLLVGSRAARERIDANRIALDQALDQARAKLDHALDLLHRRLHPVVDADTRDVPPGLDR